MLTQQIDVKRYVITAVFLGTLLLFSIQKWKPSSPGIAMESRIHPESPVRVGTSDVSPGSGIPLRTKSNPRPFVPKSTAEETNRMLRETVLKRFATESDITVVEFVTAINQAIQAAGIAPHELRISVNRADQVANLRIRDSLELADITVHNALNAHFGRTKITYKPREGGRVDLVDITQELPDESEPSTIITDPAPTR